MHDQPIEHNPLGGQIERGREWVLEAILASLVLRYMGYENPMGARKRIAEAFAGNKQFSEADVQRVLLSWERAPSDAPTMEQWREFFRGLPLERQRDAAFNIEKFLPRSEWRPRLSPPSGLTDCEALIELGLCTQGPPKVPCDSCGQQVLNVPSRVAWSAEGWLMHLGCPTAGKYEEAPAKKAHPRRTANDGIQRTLNFASGGQEFVMLHLDCPKADGPKGSLMRLRAVWVGPGVDRTGVRLSFVCMACGQDDAIEPLSDDTVELVDVEGGRWKHYYSDVESLVARGEQHEVEFKECWRVNLRTREADDRARAQVIKAVCSFRNADGGTVLVGVNKVGDIVGLDADLALQGVEHTLAVDKLQLDVQHLIRDWIGLEAFLGCQLAIHDTDGGHILEIKVDPADAPEEVRGGPLAGFWIRQGGESVLLKGEQRLRYVQGRFLSNG